MSRVVCDSRPQPQPALLLADVTPEQLAAMLAIGAQQGATTSWPGLAGQALRDRARDLLRRWNAWSRLPQWMEADQPIEALRWSVCQHFARCGDRMPYLRAYTRMTHRTEIAAVACWLDHSAADLDFLQDLLWAWCDQHDWSAPHNHVRNDLHSTHIAALLSEIVAMLVDRLEPQVTERVRGEVERRVLRPGLDPHRYEGWWDCNNNWNFVCNGNLALATLALRSGDDRGRCVHQLIRRMDHALAGFGDDGSCFEGPGYWEYGFGHLIEVAVCLHHLTGGQVNLLAHPRCRRILRYPVATHIAGPIRANFGDCGQTYMRTETVLMVQRLTGLHDLDPLQPPRIDGEHRLDCARDQRQGYRPPLWRSLSIYTGASGDEFSGDHGLDDAFLPDLGLVKLRVRTATGISTVVAIGGRNDLPHSHNDIGSFIYHHGGQVLMADPGAPVYTALTQGPQRDQHPFCGSQGHSVPVIDGVHQAAGPGRRGIICVDARQSASDFPGVKEVAIDMTRAYPHPDLRRLVRTIRLRPDGALEIMDRFELTRQPRSIHEVFVTSGRVEVAGTGNVMIHVGAARLELSCRGAAGRWLIESFGDPARPDSPSLSRIVFLPARLSPRMDLAFTATPAIVWGSHGDESSAPAMGAEG